MYMYNVHVHCQVFLHCCVALLRCLLLLNMKLPRVEIITRQYYSAFDLVVVNPVTPAPALVVHVNNDIMIGVDPGPSMISCLVQPLNSA